MLTERNTSSRLDTRNTRIVVRRDAVVTALLMLVIGFSLGIGVTTSILAPALVRH